MASNATRSQYGRLRDPRETIDPELPAWQTKKPNSRKIGLCSGVMIALALSLNAIVMGYVVLDPLRCSCANDRDSYSRGFLTDLDSVTPSIRIEQRQFTGGISIDDAGVYRFEESPYVGTPSREVDDAWAHLMFGLNIDLDEAEGESIKDETYNWPGTNEYFTGLTVYHSLHCLNRIRQAMYPDYHKVFQHPDDPDRDIHIAHCIDHIRQALQCHADLTPMEWTQVGKKLILKTEKMHTCRNFDLIHKWASNRMVNVDDMEIVRNGTLFVVD